MTLGRVVAVNTGQRQALVVRGSPTPSGIVKTPKPGAWRIEPEGIVGDERAGPRKFGEAHHAVLAYPVEHYAYWAATVGAGPFQPGGVGENLTVAGADEEHVRIGDVVACGAALLEVAQPRIPCRKLTARVGVDGFAQTFLRSLRVGYYLRVLRPGAVSAGDAFSVVDGASGSPTVADFVRVSQYEYWDAAGLAALLQARALMAPWRTLLEEKLQRAAEAQAQGRWFGPRLLEVVRASAQPATVALVLACARGLPLPRLGEGRRLLLSLDVGVHGGERRVFDARDAAGAAGTYEVVVPTPDSGAPVAFAALQVGAKVRAQLTD